MRRPAGTDYYETLRQIGGKAGAAVEEIHEDLQEHSKLIHLVSSDRRSALAKKVRGLHDICGMSGSSRSHSGDCGSMWNLTIVSTWSNPLRDDRAIQNAIRKIKNNSDFFSGMSI